MRFALSTLLILTVLASLASAALVSASDLFPNVLLTLAVLCPLYFAVRAAYSRASARAFAFGFVVFSVGYLLATFGPLGEQLEPGLLTTAALDRLHEAVRRDVEVSTLGQLPEGTAVFGKAVADDQGGDGMEGMMEGMSGSMAGMMTPEAEDMAGMMSGMGSMDPGMSPGMSPGMGLGMGAMGGTRPARVVSMVTVPLMPYFKRAGHALFAILLGIAGGAVARRQSHKAQSGPQE